MLIIENASIIVMFRPAIQAPLFQVVSEC